MSDDRRGDIDLKFGRLLTWSKIVDRIEISVNAEIDEGANIYEPLIGIDYTWVEKETGCEYEVSLNYEGELWGLQPA